MRIKNIYQLIILLSLAVSMQAFSLDEAVSVALKNSTEIQKASMNVEIAKADMQEKQAQNYGRFDLLASYAHYNLPRTLTPLTPVSVAGGAAIIPTTQDMFVGGISYSVELFTGMQNTRSIEVASLQKEIADNLRFLSREQLIYNVKTLYVNILALQAQRDAQTLYVKALKDLHESVAYKVELARLAKIDELKSLADLNRASLGLNEIESNIEILKSTLAATMLVKEVSNFEKIEIEVVDVGESQESYDAALAQTKRQRLATLDTNKKIKEEEEKTFAMKYPKVGFNGYYGLSSGINDGSNAYSGDFKSADVWQAGVDLKWNIFDFGKTSSLIQKSRIKTMQSRLDAVKTKRELQSSLTQALIKIKLSVKTFASAKSELALMKETQKIEQLLYDNGASNINDLLYSKARYQLANSSYISSKHNYQNSLNYLNYLLEKGHEK